MYETIGPFQLVLGGSILIFIISGLFIILYYHFSRKMVITKLQKNHLILEHQKELLKNEIAIIEKERKRIARDLHDEVGANLAYIGLTLTQLTKEQKTVESFIQKVEICKDQINQTITVVRRISHDLLPPVLDMFGLVPAIQEFLNKLDSHFIVDYNADESFNNLDSETALQLYRVILELINNSVKHSGGNRLSVEMIILDGRKAVLVKDNGIGFNFHEMKTNVGLGLKNIICRLESIEAEYAFLSNNEGGSNVIITLKPNS